MLQSCNAMTKTNIEKPLAGLGERLSFARKNAGLNTPNLAAKIGYSDTAIRGVESGNQAPSLRFLAAVSTALAIDLNWLRTGEGQMEAGEFQQLTVRAQNLLRDLEQQTSTAPPAPDSSDARVIAVLRGLVALMANYQVEVNQRSQISERATKLLLELESRTADAPPDRGSPVALAIADLRDIVDLAAEQKRQAAALESVLVTKSV